MPTKTKPETGALERRYTTLRDGASKREETHIGFKGHAARFNSPTWIGPKRWGFREQIAPGAFAKTAKDGDVRFLINHDPNLVLARSTKGTLRLSEDDEGLFTDADLARTSYGEDLAISLERGDITQMSFAFEVLSEEWETDDESGEETRTLLEVKLWDVSAVTYPAYDDTDAGLRTVAFDVLSARMGLTTAKRQRLIAGLAHDEIDGETRALLEQAQQRFARLLSDDDGPATATRTADEPVEPARATSRSSNPTALLRRRLSLLNRADDAPGQAPPAS
jgi:HK97 family phage prohead protease